MGIEMKMRLKVIFMAFGFLSACQVGRAPVSLNMQDRSLTGATNKYEQPYVDYRSDLIEEHVEEMEKKIIVYEHPRPSPTSSQDNDSQSSDQEKESIDAPFEWNKDDTKIVYFKRTYNQNLKKISWTVTTNDPHNGRQEHSFTGTPAPLQYSDEKGLREVAAAISNTGLASSFTCLKSNCLDAFVIIKQDQEHVADIYVGTERRKAKIQVEEEAAQAIGKRFPKLSKLYTPNNEVHMDVTIVQTNPGYVSIQIQYQDLIDVHGELLYDGGVCTPLYFRGTVRHRGEYCMAGNNHRAGLIVNFSTRIEDKEYNADIFMLEADSVLSSDKEETEEKVEEPIVSVDVTVTEEAHDIIRQLTPDFQRDAIQREAKDRWMPGGLAGRSMRNFLNYHHRAVTGDMNGLSSEQQNRVREFRTVMDIVARFSFPRAIIFKTLAESLFNRFASSSKEAVGLWQITPILAEDYNLPLSQRTDVVRSTEVAMNYMKDLFTGKYSQLWRGDIKLAIAAYNLGQGGLEEAIGKAASESRGRGRALSLQDAMRISSGLNSQSEGEEKNTFWGLSGLNLLPSESEQHVVRVVSAMMVGISPEDFGYESMTAFPVSE